MYYSRYTAGVRNGCLLRYPWLLVVAPLVIVGIVWVLVSVL